MIVVEHVVVVTPDTATHPVIGWENLLEDGTVVGVPTTNAENAYDWRTSDTWTTNAASGTLTLTLTEAQPADFFAFCAHTLASVEASIKLEYNQGGGWTDVTGAAAAPADSRPTMLLFDEVWSAQWRVMVTTNGSAAQLGVVSFGSRLTLERGLVAGFTPPTLSRVDTLMPAKTETGNLVNKSVTRRGTRGEIALANLSEAWVRETFDEFAQHARTLPWFFAWDPVGHPDEVAYVQITDPIDMPYQAARRMSATVRYDGLAE